MILALYTDIIHNFILTEEDRYKNIVILSIKLLLHEISGEVCKNKPNIFSCCYVSKCVLTFVYPIVLVALVCNRIKLARSHGQ